MKKLLTVIIFIISFSSVAEDYSMRKCMLLPIPDTVGNVIGFKIYEGVERYIKRKKWCDYSSSSDVIGIFSKYRDKLADFLDDPNVIKTVADRLKVGSIIKIGIIKESETLKVSMDVIGENGVDKYFSEKAIINKLDVYETMVLLKNWIDLYETTIPYDGKLSGVLGEQVTFNFAKNKRIAIGQEFKIKRFLGKKRHPLLKKIVEWDSEVIAKGKVFNLSRGQALGVVKLYTSNKKVSSGDWVKLEKYDPTKIHGDKDFSKYDQQKFGRLGDLSLALNISSHSTATSSYTGNNKMAGYTYGVSAELETWITRNYFVLAEYSKKIGNLSKTSGSPNEDTSAQSTSTLKIAGGLKYLPMGFFYGPQVNFYTGWVRYSYQMDSSGLDGFGTNSMSGILLGVGGNIPLKKGIRIFGSGEIIPFGDFTDDDNFFGSKKSLSSLALEVGSHYQWTPTVRFLGSFEIISNSAKFSGTNSQLRYSDTTLKLGGVFSF